MKDQRFVLIVDAWVITIGSQHSIPSFPSSFIIVRTELTFNTTSSVTAKTVVWVTIGSYKSTNVGNVFRFMERDKKLKLVELETLKLTTWLLGLKKLNVKQHKREIINTKFLWHVNELREETNHMVDSPNLNLKERNFERFKHDMHCESKNITEKQNRSGEHSENSLKKQNLNSPYLIEFESSLSLLYLYILLFFA